jgi:hypothetical protein
LLLSDIIQASSVSDSGQDGMPEKNLLRAYLINVINNLQEHINPSDLRRFD